LVLILWFFFNPLIKELFLPCNLFFLIFNLIILITIFLF
jgi:hypothetical protein